MPANQEGLEKATKNTAIKYETTGKTEVTERGENPREAFDCAMSEQLHDTNKQ